MTEKSMTAWDWGAGREKHRRGYKGGQGDVVVDGDAGYLECSYSFRGTHIHQN